MIHINLLPEEYRQANRTPIRFTVGVCVAVAINCSLLAWWSGMAFGVKAEVNSELAVLQDTKSSIDPQVTYHKSLEEENAIYISRESTLREITGNRMSWTKKVDELIDVVNRGGYGEKYLIWFNDLSVRQTATGSNGGSFGSLSVSGHSGNANFDHIANFFDDLEGSPFIADFGALSPPQGTQSSIDKDLLPAENWSFPLELNLLSPAERVEAAALRASLIEESDSNE